MNLFTCSNPNLKKISFPTANKDFKEACENISQQFSSIEFEFQSFIFEESRKDSWFTIQEQSLELFMWEGGDNWSCMLSPKIIMGQISVLRLELVKCSDGAVLVGVGNKDIDTAYYVGNNSNSASCYFKNRGGGDSMKVIFGSTSSGYGKYA